MRGVLPVLPDLTQPPFDDVSRPGRAAFVRQTDDMIRRLHGKTASDRELAALSLVWGNCPRESYKTLLNKIKECGIVQD